MYKLCKTEQSAKRQRQLEEGLLRMMSSTAYEEITVSSLCDYLQVPRKSFYRYFSSKDGALHALIDHTLMQYEGSSSIYHPGEKRTLQRELEQFFQFWVEQKPLLDALLRCRMSGVLVERSMALATSMNGMPARFLPNDPPAIRHQVILFCVSGLMSMMLTWHREAYPHSVSHMAAVSVRLICQPLFPQIEELL